MFTYHNMIGSIELRMQYLIQLHFSIIPFPDFSRFPEFFPGLSTTVLTGADFPPGFFPDPPVFFPETRTKLA